MAAQKLNALPTHSGVDMIHSTFGMDPYLIVKEK